MPPEDHDHFEDQLAAALRHTGGAFEADRHTLVTGGEAHGRRIRRRRAAVAGCAAGVALVGLARPCSRQAPVESSGPSPPSRHSLVLTLALTRTTTRRDG